MAKDRLGLKKVCSLIQALKELPSTFLIPTLDNTISTVRAVRPTKKVHN